MTTYLARWLIKRLRDVDVEVLVELKAALKDFDARKKQWPLLEALKASIDVKRREADIRFVGDRPE